MRWTRIASAARHPATWVALPALAFVLVSLHRVGAPPTDIHDWRQSVMLGIGRAFACGQPAAQPTIALCGAQHGPMAMELPLYAYLGAWLGTLTNPWVGARLAVLLGGCCAVVGIALLALDLVPRRWSRGARMAGTLGAGLVVVASPLPRHWLAALLPDPIAWGFVLLAAGALAFAPPKWRWLAPLSLLAGIGAATKLFAAPFVLLTALYVARAWAPPAFWRPSTWLRWMPALVVHGVLAAAPAVLWYGVRNPAVLRAHPCSVFLTSPVDSPWTVLKDPETQRALRDLISNASGPLLGLFVPGLIVLLLKARWRTAALVGATGCVLVLSASLGWHMRAHEYDGLYWTPITALSIGAALALLGEGAQRIGRFGAVILVGAAGVSSAMWVLDAVADRQRLSHSSFLLEAGHDVNQVLDPSEGVQENVWENPLLSYFSGRRSRVLAHWFPEEKCESLDFDCAADLKEEKPADCFLGKSTAHVYYEGVELHCGMKEPSTAAARMLAHLKAHTERFYDSPQQLPDGGRVVAVDAWSLTGAAGHAAPGRHIDVYVEGRTNTSLDVVVAGEKLEAKAPATTRSLSGTSIVDYRLLLPDGGDVVELHLTPGAPAMVLHVKRLGPAAWDCEQGPRANDRLQAPAPRAR